MHRHQVAEPDERVQLDQVDMARLARLGGVKHQEQVVRVGMDLRKVAPSPAVGDGDRVEAEDVGEQAFRFRVELRDVDPDKAVAPGEERGELLGLPRLDLPTGDPEEVHGSCLSARRGAVHPNRLLEDLGDVEDLQVL